MSGRLTAVIAATLFSAALASAGDVVTGYQFVGHLGYRAADGEFVRLMPDDVLVDNPELRAGRALVTSMIDDHPILGEQLVDDPATLTDPARHTEAVNHLYVATAQTIALRRGGFDLGPLVLAYVLGPTFERSLRQGLLISDGELGILLERPIALGFVLAAIATLAAAVLLRNRARVAD